MWHARLSGQVQTLLFSATLPSWVKDITRRFLQPGHKLVDLVGTDKMKVPAAALFALLRGILLGAFPRVSS